MTLKELGVTPAKEKQFNKKNIFTPNDLMEFFPRKYNDFSLVSGILPQEFESTLIVKINRVKQYSDKINMIMAFGTIPGTWEKVNICWFRQGYLFSSISDCVDSQVFVAGKAVYNEQYHSYTISNPLIFTKEIHAAQKIYPVYSKITGMSEKYLTEKIYNALHTLAAESENCPERIIESENLMRMPEAIMELHNPTTQKRLNEARNRMIFNDLLYFALRMTYAERKNSKGSQYGITTLKTYNQVLNSLPFQLTEDQQKSVDDILQFIKEGKRINALVQGDVGAGKTIIAFLLMIAMIDSGYQAALMAPTQVLARQHYEDLKNMLEPYGIEVAFYGGTRLKKKEKTALIEGLKTGRIKIIVGTHALLNKDIEFKDLALVVTDEEHKFGVIQRQSLVEKAANGVHSITMSATPIPRSLAQVIYGNSIQLFTVRTMPRGRKPVKTVISDNYEKVFKFLESQLAEGRQAYVVCPMIDKNEDMEGVKSVEEISDIYIKYFEEKGYKIATLTGRNTKEETEEIIARFKNNETNILVSTTVIEVGVNVPNSSVIIIHNAERFGLSGLHQLRGRVGRGSYQSYCILFSEDKVNDRLNVMTRTTDGFKIAEEDLRLRGAGDFIGTAQSGDNKYMNLMLAYPDRYNRSKEIAADLLDSGEDCKILNELFIEKENEEEE